MTNPNNTMTQPSNPLSAQSVPIEIRRKSKFENKPGEVRLSTVPAPGIGLTIVWSTGQETFFPSELLRRECPCATCLESRGDSRHQKPFTGAPPAPSRRGKLQVIQATEDESLNLVAVWAVGNYALGLRWGDKHDTGIFTFESLKELAQKLDQI